MIDLFRQFAGPKWESGDAWEALFLIVLVVRCLTASFDSAVVPLDPLIVGNIQVEYNRPLNTNVDFFRETDLVDFVGGIPLRSWAPGTPVNLSTIPDTLGLKPMTSSLPSGIRTETGWCMGTS